MPIPNQQIFGTSKLYPKERDGVTVYVKERALLRNLDEKIIQEAKLMEKLRHRNIIHYISHEITGEILRITMEYCHGGSLESYLRLISSRDRQFLQAGTIVKLAIEMLDGLNYLHSHNYVHRAICPGNILLTIDMTAVLSNFSTSRIVSGSMTTLASQSAYAPKDQYAEGYNNSVDIFALGCVWYELITFNPLFTISTIIHSKEPRYVIPNELEPYLGKDFIDIIRRMTSLEPSRRIKISEIYKTKFFTDYREKQTGLLMIPLFCDPCPPVFAENDYNYCIKNLVF